MSSTNRQLAAIMFTDIVGYTALMGSDESKALSVLKTNRYIHKKLIKKYRGKWLKEMGDGTLASFKTISDAVYCAGEVIKSCNEDGIELRIGIHFGEVTEDNGDIFGDGVNVAARLEPLAKPDQILVSESIHRNVKNKHGIQSTFLEEKRLKNVAESVRVYRVEVETIPNPTTKHNRKTIIIAVGLAFAILLIYSLARYFDIEKSAEISALEKSIAVLPFKNLSPNETDQYLADGMMEAILNHLQRIEDLSVRSRTSTESYRDTPKNITEIGKELEVNYILEGSFQKVGDQANLVVQLIIAETDEHLWSEEYNRNWSEIFVVQKEVAILIADELYASMTDEARKGIDVTPTDNILAYELYLKGKESSWSFWSDRDKTKLDESVEFYRKAIELDENYSLAYTGLVETYSILEGLSVSNSEKTELRKLCMNYIRKAIELDRYNGWAYSEYGHLLANWNRDTTAARKNFDIAIKLQPNNIDVLMDYFQRELTLRNCDKLKWIHQRMLKIEPHRNKPFNNFNLKLLQCQNKYSEIAEIADEYGIQSSYQLLQARLYFYGYLYSQNFNKANQLLTYIKGKSKEKRNCLYYEGLLRAAEGNTELALASIDSLLLISKIEKVPNSYIARIYAALGDEVQMYKYLEKAISDKQMLRSLINAPEYIPYRDDPKFQEIRPEFWILEDRNEE